MHSADRHILDGIKAGDQASLRTLFDLYFKDLVLFSARMVVNTGVAEEIVEDVFIRIWQTREEMDLSDSFKSYLFASVKNRSINYLKSTYGKMHFEELESASHRISGSGQDLEIQGRELGEAIAKAIENLPPGCRVIFSLSRNAGFTTAEISEQLDISKKTVQAQIAIAIRKIREQLGDLLADF
jgi:RNA polymerase sigma-70 factor (ECF subfamily)